MALIPEAAVRLRVPYTREDVERFLDAVYSEDLRTIDGFSFDLLFENIPSFTVPMYTAEPDGPRLLCMDTILPQPIRPGRLDSVGVFIPNDGSRVVVYGVCSLHRSYTRQAVEKRERNLLSFIREATELGKRWVATEGEK